MAAGCRRAKKTVRHLPSLSPSAIARVSRIGTRPHGVRRKTRTRTEGMGEKGGARGKKVRPINARHNVDPPSPSYEVTPYSVLRNPAQIPPFLTLPDYPLPEASPRWTLDNSDRTQAPGRPPSAPSWPYRRQKGRCRHFDEACRGGRMVWDWSVCWKVGGRHAGR